MPLFKPSAKKVVETIFSEFTPEEMKILESPDLQHPQLYSNLIKYVCPSSKSKYSLEKSKEIAYFCIYPFRNKLTDPTVRKEIFDIFIQEILVG